MKTVLLYTRFSIYFFQITKLVGRGNNSRLHWMQFEQHRGQADQWTMKKPTLTDLILPKCPLKMLTELESTVSCVI